MIMVLELLKRNHVLSNVTGICQSHNSIIRVLRQRMGFLISWNSLNSTRTFFIFHEFNDDPDQ